MKVYVANESLSDSVEHFRGKSFTSPEQLGLFLLFKSIGMNSKEYMSLADFDAETKNKMLGNLYCLAGLFDRSSETGNKKTCLFPFSISPLVRKSAFYNGGTQFSGLLGRINDTIDNTLVDDGKFLRKDETRNKFYRFAPNYIDLLSSSFLQGGKISIGMLAAWYFRFFEFNVPNEWENAPEDHQLDFTRLCIKKLRDELNITTDENNALFEDDGFIIKFKKTMTTGEYLRGLISFEEDARPEVERNPMPLLQSLKTVLALDEVNGILTPRGRNITPDRLCELLLDTKQVVLAGPPGTGKTYISDKIKLKFAYSQLIQFHPNLTYEQFIGGQVFNKAGNVVSKAGIFVEFCEKARKEPGKKYLFLIDEINRGNLSKIFGEVILTLDREYKAHLPIPLSLAGGGEVVEFSIPSNVYIVATMNSADRSIALVDYAIRRRFAFVDFYPNSEIVEYLSDFSQVGINVARLMEKLNDKMFSVLGDTDFLLGQSFFIPKWAFSAGKVKWTNDILKTMFNYYVLPIVEEYTYGNQRFLLNIMGENLINRIDNTDEFIKEIKKQFYL